jgi:hypothetical protein
LYIAEKIERFFGGRFSSHNWNQLISMSLIL